MPTNKAEAIHFMKIIHDWVSPKVARMMMDDIYALDIDWTTPVMVTFLVITGLGFWSYLCWWSFRQS